MADDLEVRELTVDEQPASWQMGRLAFGGHGEPPPEVYEVQQGRTLYGAFDKSGRQLGKALDRHQEQWWCGRKVSSADIGGVAVIPEARGRGVARAVLSGLLRGAHDRGAAVSALFPSVAAAYRSFGWEVVGAMPHRDLPVNAVPRHRPSAKLTTRPGDHRDLPSVVDLYEEIARNRCGMLTRRGPLFDGSYAAAQALPSWMDGLSLVEDGEKLVGYAIWRRSDGYGPQARLDVPDLLALTPEAAREIVGVLASWRSIIGVLRLRPLAFDTVSTVLPLEWSHEVEYQQWMHRPVDVVAAVQDRGWPAHVRGSVDFVLDDALAPWNAGAWRLDISDGAGKLQRTGRDPGLRLKVNGFALLYAGACSASSLVGMGYLETSGGANPATLDLLGCGEPAQLLNHF